MPRLMVFQLRQFLVAANIEMNVGIYKYISNSLARGSSKLRLESLWKHEMYVLLINLVGFIDQKTDSECRKSFLVTIFLPHR